MAPELIVMMGIPYDQRVDVWALGVIAFMLLSAGKFPFDIDKEMDVFTEQILMLEPDYEKIERVWPKGELAADFVRQCLVKDYRNRATVDDLLGHAWLAPENRILPLPVPNEQVEKMIENMIKFVKRDAFQSGVISLLFMLKYDRYERFQISKLFKTFDLDK